MHHAKYVVKFFEQALTLCQILRFSYAILIPEGVIDMIEVIYKDEKQEPKGNEEAFELPRNIRQIGLANEDYRIYIEDYVYTFLGKVLQSDEDNKEKCMSAVLTGQLKWNGGITYVFIKGALTVEDDEITEEHIDLTDTLWQKIHEEQEKYFDGQDIVGWFLGKKGLMMEPSEFLIKVHQKHFGGDKVLMLMDPTEKEETFFRYENNYLIKTNGFYIYYEKNPQMQNYMVEKNPELYQNQREEIQDEAVHTFRKIIQKKNQGKKRETEEHTSVFSYAATACLVLAIVAVGGKMYKNYQLMESVNPKTEQVSAKKKITVIPEKTDDPAVAKKKETVKTEITKAAITQAEVTKIPVTQPAITEAPAAEVREKETTPVPAEKNKAYKEEADIRKAEKRMRAEETSTASQRTYVIRPGDTLYQISVVNYGTTDKISEICKANGIAEDEIIYPGQIIVLP